MLGWVDLVRCIEAGGVVVIVAGLLAATLSFGRSLAGQTGSFEELYPVYRRRLGQAILLGLELLVAADIVGTVAVNPTLASVGVLDLIVLVRTFLSMALEIEMEGRLPWKRVAK
jgi:uncharacterized membrane protein